MKLSSSQVFITRIPTISLTCSSTITEIKTPQIQVIYSIPCGCVFEAAGQLIVNNECYDSRRQNFMFPVNLKLLYNFFQPSIAEWSLTADTLVNQDIDIVIPKLLVQEQRLVDNLAIEKALQFDLNAIINRSRDNIKLYASLSNILLDRLESIEKTPITQNQWLTYFVYATGISSFMSLIAVVLLTRKVYSLTLLLAARTATAAVILCRQF
jgi:hypothetical protein